MTREEAIEHLKDIKKYALFGNPQNTALNIAIKALEQEPKIGYWIIEGEVGNGNRYCHCSECGHGDEQAITQVVPYCWWCGAKMIEPQESDVIDGNDD